MDAQKIGAIVDYLMKSQFIIEGYNYYNHREQEPKQCSEVCRELAIDILKAIEGKAK